jgi:hypothetical protein
MRADLAPLAATVLYLLPGFGVLAALGMLRPTATGALAAAGLAYITGVAAVLLPAIAVTTLGVPLDLVGIIVIAIVVAAGGFAVARTRSGTGVDRAGGTARHRAARVRLRRPDWGMETWAAIVLAAALAVYAVIGYVGTTVEPLAGWDAMSIWARKALLLVEYGRPTTEFFGSGFYEFMNPDYPILLPFYESVFFRLAGTADFQLLHGQFWILFVSFLWAAGFLCSRRGQPIVWLPLIALVAVTPGLAGDIRTLYADVPMSLFLGLGVLLLGSWIADRARADLALAALMLAAAANTKNEGLAAAAGVLVVAAMVVAASERGRGALRAILPLLLASAAVAVAVAPWQIWVAVNDVPTVTIPVGKGFDPVFLADHADRIWPAVSAIGAELGDPSRWHYLLPLAVALCVVSIGAGAERRLAIFYLAAGAVIFAAVVIWGYVINTIPIDSLIETTVSRTVDAVMLVAVAALLQLSARSVPARRARSSAPLGTSASRSNG